VKIALRERLNEKLSVCQSVSLSVSQLCQSLHCWKRRTTTTHIKICKLEFQKYSNIVEALPTPFPVWVLLCPSLYPSSTRPLSPTTPQLLFSLLYIYIYTLTHIVNPILGACKFRTQPLRLCRCRCRRRRRRLSLRQQQQQQWVWQQTEPPLFAFSSAHAAS